MSNKNRERIASAVQAAFETMEARQLLSSVQVTDGVLIIDADPHTASNIIVDLHAPQGRIRGYCAGVEATFAAADVKAVRVVGSDGDDTVYIDPGLKLPTLIQTGPGNDRVRGGAGVDTVDAGPGNDTVLGGRGDDHIAGGDGDDVIHGNVGNDVIDGGAGDDSAYGEDGDDTIYGGEGFDLLAGQGGDDKIYGGEGVDRLAGGTGHDDLFGGAGDDVVEGQSGNDDLVGGSGVDTLHAGMGHGNTVDSAGDNGEDAPAGLTEAPEVTTPAPSPAGNGGGDATNTPAPTPAPVQEAPPPVNDSPSPAPDAGDTGGTGGTDNGATDSGTGATDAKAPKPVIRMIGDGDLIAGGTVHVQGVDSVLNGGTVLNSKFSWDFGDPTGRFNHLDGFNAAHVYDNAGVYTVRLTVTADSGKAASATVKVNVTADDRPTIYVDGAKGSDDNDGSSPAKAVKTAPRAFALAADDTRILFKRGQRFTINQAIVINEDRLLVGAYGTGSLPVLYRVAGVGEGMLRTTPDAEDVTIEDLKFDSEYKADADGAVPKVPATALYAGGTNITLRNAQFGDINTAVNANQSPTGLMVMDSETTKSYGTRSYFVWGQGSDLVVLGNYSAGSTREHDVRTSGVERQLIAYNDFAQPDRSAVDPADIQKGCIEVHRGLYAYVAENTVHGGVIRVGPRGGTTEATDSETAWVVIEDNRCDDVGIQLYAGSHHVMIRGNVVNRYASVKAGPAIALFGPMDGNPRQSGDVYVEHNTGIEKRAAGSFLKLYAAMQPGSVTVTDNLWVNANFTAGNNSSSGIYASEDNLASFREISGNVWATPKASANWATDGVNYVGSTWGKRGAYKTADQWNAMPEVGTDYFTNDVTLKDVFQVKLHDTTAGSELRLAA